MKTESTKFDIAFVLLPPSSTAIPSPAFSILKGFLELHGIKSEIIYANHLLEIDNEFFREENTSETEALLPFLYLLDNFAQEKTEYIKTFFRCFWPDLFLMDRSIEDEIYQDIYKKYYSFINSLINHIKRNQIKIVGFTSKFYQWVSATVVAKYIKEACPDVKIISGGWTNSVAASSFMKLNPHFDYALWGEGEIPLKSLLELIYGDNKYSIENIPRIVYKKSNELCKTKNGNIDSYINYATDEIYPNFDDYFGSIKKIKQTEFLIPIERGRGCNWNKCTFCYLSQGYEFRTKPNNVLIKEMERLIQKHDISKFFFTDNDVVGSDVDYFNDFLDRLIKLKEQYPNINITMAEIISKDVNYDTIVKMKQAGFANIQVGLEAISEKLLTDINKKQTIVDNFFFIKSAKECGITIKGANIIIDTPNETDEMIMESINSLHSYRFLLADPNFELNVIPLAVANFSKYLRIIKNKKEEDNWSISEIKQLISDDYVKKIDRFSLMDFVLNRAEKPLWNSFHRALKYYKRKKYNYQIDVDKENKIIVYKEFIGDKLIKEILFDEDIYWHILQEINNKIIIEKELFNNLEKMGFLDGYSVKDCLNELHSQDIIIIDSLGNMTSIIKIAF